jgi:hypothetical protein
MLLLDIINMFNSISHETVCHILATHPTFSYLLPLFDFLYNESNTCWFLMPNFLWSSFFQQFEGFTQGCPLSRVCCPCP